MLLLALILTLFSGALYFSAHYLLRRNLDIELNGKAQEIISIINVYADTMGQKSGAFIAGAQEVIHFKKAELSSPGATITIEKRLYEIVDKYDLSSDFVCLRDENGTVVAQSAPVSPSTDSLEALLKQWSISFVQGKKSRQEYKTIAGFRSILVPLRSRDGEFYSFQAATSTHLIDKLLQEWSFFVVVAIVIFLGLASFLGNLFAAQILNPITIVTDAARKITHEDLAARVKVNAVDEEMVSLIGAFNEMITRLEKSFAAISEFSSHVAHELKTPLAVMRGETELAIRKDREVGDYKKVLSNNLKEIQRMIRVIDDMLLLTTLDYDPQALQFERVEFGEFIGELAESAKILARPKNIHVSLMMPENPLWISGDSTHLRRLFLNLIENAVKFSRHNEKVGLRVTSHGQMLEVEVADSGPGIPESDLPRIFDKFFHRERTVNPETIGHGLGLSIALLIAKAHQGDIRVQTQPNQGSTFTVTLPRLRS